MAIGERMRYFRALRDMTQKYLGESLGLSEKTADARIAQYESGNRTPKADMIEKLASTLDVSPHALDVPDIDSYIGLMHTLFTLEDCYGLTITSLDGQVCLKQDINHPNYSMTLAEDLISWNGIKTKLTTGSITHAEYDRWRYHFPEEQIRSSKASIDEKRKDI